MTTETRKIETYCGEIVQTVHKKCGSTIVLNREPPQVRGKYRYTRCTCGAELRMGDASLRHYGIPENPDAVISREEDETMDAMNEDMAT